MRTSNVPFTVFQLTGSVITWTYKQWEDCIAENFENKFYVPLTPSSTEPRPDLVHRRGIYKDSYGAGQPWADYQLRCNFPIAMAVVSTIKYHLPQSQQLLQCPLTKNYEHWSPHF